MKRGTRCRKRKASAKEDTLASSDALETHQQHPTSPLQGLTQNSSGRLVPCFSKKLRSKAASVPATATKPELQEQAVPAGCETGPSVCEEVKEKVTQDEVCVHAPTMLTCYDYAHTHTHSHRYHPLLQPVTHQQNLSVKSWHIQRMSITQRRPHLMEKAATITNQHNTHKYHFHHQHHYCLLLHHCPVISQYLVRACLKSSYPIFTWKPSAVMPANQ